MVRRPVERSKRKRSRLAYPWSSWLGQEQVTLWQGSDYDCSQMSFAQQVRNAAVKMKLKVRVEDGGDHFRIFVLRKS